MPNIEENAALMLFLVARASWPKFGKINRHKMDSTKDTKAILYSYNVSIFYELRYYLFD